MSRRSGYSLLELMIAMAVTMLLLNSVYRLLQAGGRIFTKLQTHATLQEDGLVALTRLTGDLRMASWSTLTIRTAPVAISFQPLPLNPMALDLAPPLPGPPPSTGLFVVYYLDTLHRCLQRGQTQYTLSYRMDAGALQHEPVQPGIVARQVDSLEVSPGTFPTDSTQAKAVHLTLRLSTPSTRETVFMAASPRN